MNLSALRAEPCYFEDLGVGNTFDAARPENHHPS